MSEKLHPFDMSNPKDPISAAPGPDLESWPQQWQDPKGHPSQAEPYNDSQKPRNGWLSLTRGKQMEPPN